VLLNDRSLNDYLLGLQQSVLFHSLRLFFHLDLLLQRAQQVACVVVVRGVPLFSRKGLLLMLVRLNNLFADVRVFNILVVFFLACIVQVGVEVKHLAPSQVHLVDVAVHLLA